MVPGSDFYAAELRSRHGEKLFVVTSISNFHRYHSRPYLYNKFRDHITVSGAKLLTVEAAFGDRHHTVTEPGNPWHIQLRTDHDLWLKECMLNIGISRLPADWKYVAWMDADIEFVRKDWVDETIQQLQHYSLVQPWSECIDMLPNYEINQYHKSFTYCWQEHIHGRLPISVDDTLDYYSTDAGRRAGYFHSGFAWAARREAIDALGGLIDWSVCGAGDHHMALALVGRLKKSIHGQCSPGFKASMNEWEMRAMKYIRKNIGYVPGTIIHSWHGAKTNRKYKDRWAVMVDSQFDPAVDLKKDWQGLYQLTDRRGEQSIKLRDDLREYFRTRNEDSIDPYPPEKLIGTMLVKFEQTPLSIQQPLTVEDADKPA